MKKGIRCNETHYTNGIDRTRITYEFLSDDGNTPASCTVRLGDLDPISGERITDLSFFKEYYRLVDHEVMRNVQAARPDYTSSEKVRRKKLREAFIEEFTMDHGYAPSMADVLDVMDHQEQERYHLSLDALTDKETGRNNTDRHMAFSVPFSAEADESVCMQALREVAASLTGRKAEVYQAMIQRAAGSQMRLRFSEIAKRWGVAPKQINKDQQKIMEMVRKRAKELQAED